MEISKQQLKYISAVVEHAPDLGIDTTKTNYSRAELRQVSMRMKGKVWIPNWITHDQSRRVSRGVFSIPEIMNHTQAVSPGHGNDGDDLSDGVFTHQPDSVDPVMTEADTSLNEFGNEVVGDDMPLVESQIAQDMMHSS